MRSHTRRIISDDQVAREAKIFWVQCGGFGGRNRLAVGTLPYNLSLEDTSKVLAMINVGM